MQSADYLRRQAAACLLIARTCFDLTSAERLRHLAGELWAKAAEIERQHGHLGPMLDRDEVSDRESYRR
jgi:hypothetical protein